MLQKYIWHLINSEYKLDANIVIIFMDNMSSTIIGENMRYFMYNYKFTTKHWNTARSFLNNSIDNNVNSTINLDTVHVCTATATVIKELCQAREICDTPKTY